MIFMGTVALGPIRNWMNMKRARRMNARMNKMIIRAEDHAYVVPPHWRARRRQTIPGRKTREPKGSSFQICCLSVSVFLLGFVWRTKRTMATTTAPMGRLM